jgi:hypothetical protein
LCISTFQHIFIRFHYFYDLFRAEDFHFMRDHPLHGGTILGCGWGTKLLSREVRNKWKETWENGLKDPIVWSSRESHGPDQEFLDRSFLIVN